MITAMMMITMTHMTNIINSNVNLYIYGNQ